MMVSVPAQALTLEPTNPTFVGGEPSPAMTMTTRNIDGNPTNVKTVELEFITGRDRWSPIASCPAFGSHTSTLSSCGVISVKSTDNGGTPEDQTSNAQVSLTGAGGGRILITFSTALPPLVSPATRVLEIALSDGAFTAPAVIDGLEIILLFSSEPNGANGGINSTGDEQRLSGYSGVSFSGGTGSTGSMPSILASSTSNLPANTFSKSGFNFSGWSCTQGGGVSYADQAVMTDIFLCPTLYAVWTAVGSNTTPGEGETTPTPENSSGEELAHTGVEAEWLMAAGLLAAIAGSGLLVSSRRKRIL